MRLIIFLILIAPVLGQSLTREQTSILAYKKGAQSWHTENGVLFWTDKTESAPTIAEIESWRSEWESSKTASQTASKISTNNDAILLWAEQLTKTLIDKGVISTLDIPRDTLDALNQRRKLRGDPEL